MMSGSVWIRLIRTSCCSSAETCRNTHQIQASLKIISISRTDGTSQLSGEGESHWGKRAESVDPGQTWKIIRVSRVARA